MNSNENELENMTGPQWTRQLMKDPALADKCDWGKLDGTDWALLLLDNPQFADRCDWGKLDGGDWSLLLLAQPQFAAFKPAALSMEKTETRRHGD